MIWPESDLTYWLLNSGEDDWGPGSDQAMSITRADLETEGVRLTNMRHTFVFASLSILPVFWFGLQVLFGNTVELAISLLLLVPAAVLHLFLGADLAHNILPVKPHVTGLFFLAAAGVPVAINFVFGNLDTTAIGLCIMAYGCLLLWPYARAALDKGFSERASVVRTIQRQFKGDARQREFELAHGRQSTIGTFQAALRDAPDTKTAIETTLKTLRPNTKAGATTARQILNEQAEAYRRKQMP